MAGYTGMTDMSYRTTRLLKLRLKICKDPDPESFPFFIAAIFASSNANSHNFIHLNLPTTINFYQS